MLLYFFRFSSADAELDGRGQQDDNLWTLYSFL